MTEQDFVDKVLPRLSKYFNIYAEQWSSCGTRRIDAILQLKTDNNVFFGMEFKKIDSKRGQDLGEHILQAMRYSLLKFELANGEVRKIPIFLCPPISFIYLMCPEFKPVSVVPHPEDCHNGEYFADRHDRNNAHNSVNGMLGVLNCGELRTTIFERNGIKCQKLRLIFSNKIIWDESNEWCNIEKAFTTGKIKGLHKINYDFLITKINKFEI